ncbi:general substrate transporter [Apiospora arundinis]
MAELEHDDDGHQTAKGVGKAHGDAQAGNIDEHNTSVREALLNHRWAVMWSLTVSMSVIMEGYDTILMGNFLGFPAFQKQFGEYHDGEAGYQVAAAWQSALWGGSIAGCIIGVFVNGYLISHFGFRRVFLASLLLMTAFIFPSFFGKTPAIQTAGQVLCGIPWGIFATIGSAYASEILPLALRPYLTAYVNMCFAIGQFIGAGVIQGLLQRDDQWSYRVPFAVQWVWPVPLFIACIFMPESPWWLVQHGRLEEAEQVLRRVTWGPQQEKAPQTLAMMVHTNVIEHEIEAGSSYLDCFRGSHRRRTEIACVSFAGQVLAGSQFAYSGTYFFQQAGMGADDAYKLGLGGTAIAFVGTILSWFLMRRVGRRTIYLCGMTGIVVYLFIIGVLTTATHNNGVVWAQSSLCLVWLFTFSLSVGPMGWTIPAEVSSTRLRSKTICLARNVYYVTLLWANILEPYMVNPTSWNWRGYTGFFWCGWATLTLVWAYFRLTETKDRTFEELDLMFAAGVPTRKFAKYHVDAYAEDLAVKERVTMANAGTTEIKGIEA